MLGLLITSARLVGTMPVAFQKVYDVPHAEASAQRDYESGQGRDSLTEKCHSVSSLSAAYAAIKIG